MANHEMIQYFRGDGNHPIGVMVAIYDEKENTVRIGWSKCNHKDQFAKEQGLMIARSRTLAGSSMPIPASREFLKEELMTIKDAITNTEFDIPSQIVVPRLQKQYENFIARTVTYFKSVPLINFIVCGPEPMFAHYLDLITDTRNADLERQTAKIGK